jgi:AraC-like DNA-binding protein
LSDTLSDVLRAVRLTGAVFFTIDAAPPWVTETPDGRAIAARIVPGSEHLIDYHIVTSGSCWGGLVGEPAVRLEAGDVIVFPHGDTHVMSSAPGLRGTPDAELYNRPEAGLPTAIERDGGGTERVALICGFLGCDARPFNPLIATLPRLIHVRAAVDDTVIGPIIKLALAESNARQAGGEVVLSHLSEVLFVEVVRRHLATLPPDQRGWLAGLRDEQVGRALGKLHEQPAHPWSLDELARAVGVSRSVLADRFVQFLGLPPMAYLAQWRMQLAATLLSATAIGLGDVAERVGYGSEAALSRAFKRLVGVAPAVWRQGKRGD